MYSDRIEIDKLVGETLTHIDQSDEQILLTTESGKKIMIHHDQDCCESVHIEDTQGNWHELIGKPLLEVNHEEILEGDPPSEYSDSWTRTTLKFKTSDATVISRWIGESNGYYSESVDIEDITKGE